MRVVSAAAGAAALSLAAATAMTLSGESLFVGPERDLDAAVRVLETLWLHALWGGPAGG